MTTFDFRKLFEAVEAGESVYQVKLPVDKTKMEPVFSESNLDLHYSVLYKHYVEKALAGEGEFQVAGAQLHTLFFEQMCEPSSSNKPSGSSKILITKEFGTFDKFKDSIIKAGLGIHGSGWVYLDTKGIIRTINNHKIVSNVAVIIDLWEHSYLDTYKADKEKYMRDFFKTVNWEIINVRLN
jgi:superoxide dismutase